MAATLLRPGRVSKNRTAAVQSTKYTKYTKDEWITRGILLDHLVNILVVPNLCPFVSFVVPIALSRFIRAHRAVRAVVVPRKWYAGGTVSEGKCWETNIQRHSV